MNLNSSRSLNQDDLPCPNFKLRLLAGQEYHIRDREAVLNKHNLRYSVDVMGGPTSSSVESLLAQPGPAGLTYENIKVIPPTGGPRLL